MIESSGVPVSRSSGADNWGWVEGVRHGAALPEPAPWLPDQCLQSSSRGDMSSLILMICKGLKYMSGKQMINWLYLIAIAEDCQPREGQWCSLFPGTISLSNLIRTTSIFETSDFWQNLVLTCLRSLRCLASWSSCEDAGLDTSSSTSYLGHPCARETSDHIFSPRT